MEYYSTENGFLEELLALRSDPLDAMLPMAAMNDFNSSNNGWNFDGFGYNTIAIPPSTTTTAFEDYSLPIDQSCINSTFGEFYTPFGGELSPPELTDSSNNKLDDTPPFLPSQEDYSAMSILEDEGQCLVANVLHSFDMQAPCKVEPLVSSTEVPTFNMGISPERKNKVKKVDGQPSKNLMAERRRRKRLNDRLSMLRSVVPKISKMDRTSILGDTIDYIKELLEKINNLQEEMDQEGSNQLNLMSIFKDVKPNEVFVKNSPKFDVERRNMDTKIEICCAGKPGLLLSTVTTLEALGLEIQQCVISCFNDFSMQASCSEDLEQRAVLNSEDMKQALFRNAGYGGRCL